MSWPVCKAYEAERQALGNQRLAVVQDPAGHFDMPISLEISSQIPLVN